MPNPFRKYVMPLGIGVLSLVTFLPILRNGFLQWDDDINFLTNTALSGLSFESIAWSFTSTPIGVYQPLAWLCFQLQFDLFGLSPVGFHAVSLGLHVVNALLFFRLAQRLCACCLPAANVDKAAFIAALLFALHPLKVEAVAWASAQPYLWAALFAQLSVLAYLDFQEEGNERGWPWQALGYFALALLSKPAVVGLPLVLLALDYFPLQRFEGRKRKVFDLRALVREKAAFFALAVLATLVAVAAREAGGIENAERLESFDGAGLSTLLAQVAHAFTFYLEKVFLPLGLAGFYPTPSDASLFTLRYFLSFSVLTAISVWLWRRREQYPALGVAWVSYVALLLPFAGFLRVGTYLVADRYAYLSTMGLTLLVGAGTASLERRRASVVLSSVLLLPLMALASVQCGHWKNSLVFWTQVLQSPEVKSAHARHVPFVATALFGSARAHCQQKQSEAGRQQALNTAAYWPGWNLDVAKLLIQCQWPADAESRLKDEVVRNPQNAEAWNYLGLTASQLGQKERAKESFRESIRRDPQALDARSNLGYLLHLEGEQEQAAQVLQEALRLAPEDMQLRGLLSLVQQGKKNELP